MLFFTCDVRALTVSRLQECAAQVPFSMVGFGNAMEHARRLAGPAALHSPVPPTRPSVRNSAASTPSRRA